jgi:hypothetical protein
MAQITKVTRNARKLQALLLGAITSTKGLSNIPTLELLDSASKLTGKAGDKEQGLLASILAELDGRTDLLEADPTVLLKLAVIVINKAGEDDGQISKDIILKATASTKGAKRV